MHVDVTAQNRLTTSASQAQVHNQELQILSQNQGRPNPHDRLSHRQRLKTSFHLLPVITPSPRPTRSVNLIIKTFGNLNNQAARKFPASSHQTRVSGHLVIFYLYSEN